MSEGSARQVGGRQRLIGMYVSAVANLQPPRPPCCMLHVHAGDAVPGTLWKLQHSPTPSRARNPRAMRVDAVAGGACSPDGPCWGMTVHPLLPLCTLVLRKQQRCWLVNLSAVSCGVSLRARCVSLCHRIGVQAGVRPSASVCQTCARAASLLVSCWVRVASFA